MVFLFIALVDEDGVLEDDSLFDLVRSDSLDMFDNYNVTNLPYRYTPRYIQK